MSAEESPRCPVAVESLMSVFKIALKQKELLFARWNSSRMGAHHSFLPQFGLYWLLSKIAVRHAGFCETSSLPPERDHHSPSSLPISSRGGSELIRRPTCPFVTVAITPGDDILNDIAGGP